MQEKETKCNCTVNATVHEYVIKLRADHVYDLYMDDQWLVSRGSVDSVLETLENILKQNS